MHWDVSIRFPRWKQISVVAAGSRFAVSNQTIKFTQDATMFWMLFIFANVGSDTKKSTETTQEHQKAELCC
jgi:hypothetical protein